MSLKPLLTGVLACFLFACNTQPEEKGTEAPKTDTVKIAESIRTNLSYLNDFNAIEGVFGNENWLLAKNKDTSYFYFSRLGKFRFTTYAYKLVKGDSANVIYSSIGPENNTLTWNFDKRKLSVISATSARVVGSVIGADSLKYVFVRMDDNRIELTYPDKKKIILYKTLPFSLFLVRSRYDYTHGTKYAFDSTRFGKKK